MTGIGWHFCDHSGVVKSGAYSKAPYSPTPEHAKTMAMKKFVLADLYGHTSFVRKVTEKNLLISSIL